MCLVYCCLVELFMIVRTFHCNYHLLCGRYLLQHENKTRFTSIYSNLNLDKLRFNRYNSIIIQLDLS